jgi:hypothetical protein
LDVLGIQVLPGTATDIFILKFGAHELQAGEGLADIKTLAMRTQTRTPETL